MKSEAQKIVTQNVKQLLRVQIHSALKKLPPESKAAASAQMLTAIQSQTAWRNAKAILLFGPLPDEPDLWPLIALALAEKQRVALPRFHSTGGYYAAAEIRDMDQDIQIGKFGIREPRQTCVEFPLNRLDLALVPGVAFDARGGRLGRGKGFYDRLLAGMPGKKCGVAFDEQMVEAVPVGPEDIRLNCILTPTRWIET